MAEKLSPVDAEKWAELKGNIQTLQMRLEYFQLYLNEKYGMRDGDHVTPELEIVRAVNPVDKRELKDAQVIVPG